MWPPEPAGWPATQDGGRDGSITQAMTLRVTHGYAHDRLTFLMCISATEALVQEVLFSRPGSVTVASLALPSWSFMSLCVLSEDMLCPLLVIPSSLHFPRYPSSLITR